ncbi:MAG: ABC transporter ATP-binding protein, partial [Lachnospiraceae bacterium]|nr:ABC transporter ATP-binding protein [Lachnospiraceae bacterium]
MRNNLKKMIHYYKPYKGIFFADLFFAFLSAMVALCIPLVVRFVTSDLIYRKPEEILHGIIYVALFLGFLMVIDFISKYFVGNYGHVMGAKIEYDLRAEIFAHMQEISFSFYDNAKVGKLMS